MITRTIVKKYHDMLLQLQSIKGKSPEKSKLVKDIKALESNFMAALKDGLHKFDLYTIKIYPHPRPKIKRALAIRKLAA